MPAQVVVGRPDSTQASGKSKSRLADRSLAALRWNYLGTVIKALAQFLVSVMLARLLGPVPFGVYSVMIIITGLGSMIVDRGLGSALIQTSHLDENIIRFALTRLMTTALAVAAALCAAAQYAGRWLSYPHIDMALYGSAVYLVAYALSVVPGAILSRELNMKWYQLAQIFAYLVAYTVVGLGGARLGLGALSLIGAFIAQSFLFTAFAYLKARHSLRPLFRLRTQKLTAFGDQVMVINLLNWSIENLDNVVVGALYGMQSLGLYSVSYNLVRTPTNNIMTTMQAVLLPAGSKARDNVAGLQIAYLTAVNGVLLVLFPVLLSTAAVSRTIIQGIYGTKWAGTETLLAPLALAMIVHSCMTGSSLLWAKGQLGVELKVELVTACLFAGSLVAVSRISLQATAWAVLAVYLFRATWLTTGILHSLQLSWKAFFRVVKGAAALGGVVAGTLYTVDYFLSPVVTHAFERLWILVAVGAIVTTSIPLAARNLIFSLEFRAFVARVRPLAPRWLQFFAEAYVGV